MFGQARDPDSLSIILHFRKSYLCLGRLGIQTHYPLSFTSENLICVWAVYRDPDSLSVILHFWKSYLCLGRLGIQTRYLSVILHFWKSDLCLGRLGIQTRYPLSFTSENLICVWAGWNPLIPCISYRLESEQTFTAWYAGYNIRVKGQFEKECMEKWHIKNYIKIMTRTIWKRIHGKVTH